MSEESEIAFALDIQASIKRNVTTVMAEAMSMRNVLRRKQANEWVTGAIEAGHDPTDARSQFQISRFEPANPRRPTVWERFLNEVATSNPDFADRFYGRSTLLIAMNSACGMLFDIKHGLEGRNPSNDLRSFAFGNPIQPILAPTTLADEIVFNVQGVEYNRIFSQSATLHRSLIVAPTKEVEVIDGARLLLAARNMVFGPIAPLQEFEIRALDLELIGGLEDDVQAASTHIAAAVGIGTRFAAALHTLGELSLLPFARSTMVAHTQGPSQHLGRRRLESSSSSLLGDLYTTLSADDLNAADGEQRVLALMDKSAADIVSGANRSFEL